MGHDLLECRDPLAEFCADAADGPVAAEHDAIGSERIEAVVDDGGQIIRGPLGFGHLGHDTADLADRVWRLGQRRHVSSPGIRVMGRCSSLAACGRQEGFGICVAAVVDDETGLRAVRDQLHGVGEFIGPHADVEAQSQLAQQLHGLDERFLQAVAAGRGTVQHLADAAHERVLGMRANVVGERVFTRSAADHGGDGRRRAAATQLRDQLDLGRVVAGGHIDFHVDGLHDVPWSNRLHVVVDRMGSAQHAFPFSSHGTRWRSRSHRCWWVSMIGRLAPSAGAGSACPNDFEFPNTPPVNRVAATQRWKSRRCMVANAPQQVPVVGNRSCSASTSMSSSRSASMATTAASAAWIVVMHGTPCCTAAARMRPSSVRAPLPLGVFITSDDFAVDHVVDQIGMSFGDLLDAFDFDARFSQSPSRSFGGQQFVAQGLQASRQIDNLFLVSCGDTEEDLPALRQQDAGRQLALGKRDREPFADPHHFARAAHFRPEHDVDAHELAERKHALFDRHVGGNRLGSDAEFPQGLAGHDLGGDLRHRHAGRLGHERHGAAGARIHFQHVDVQLAVFLLDGELHVHQPDHFQVQGHGVRRLADLLHDRAGQAVGRNGARGIAGVHPRFFDVLHDAHDDDVLAVADGVHVHFGGIFQEPVDEHRLSLSDDERRRHELLELRLVVADLHGPSAEHEAGAHQRRKADFLRLRARRVHVPRDAVGRLLEVQPFEQLLELLPVFGRFDRVDARADDRHAGRRQRRDRFSGVWPPNWTITPSGCTRSQMFSTSSVVSGSKNSRSLVS